MKKRYKQKGFSLVEMMIVVAISSIMMGAMFLLLRASDAQVQTTEASMTIQDSAREGLYRMIQEIRQSAPGQITIAADSTSISFAIPNDTVASMTNADYTVNWNNGYTVQYAVGGSNNDQVIRTETDTATSAVTTSVVANDVTAISFTGNQTPPTLVTVSLSVQRQLINGRSIPSTPMQLTGQAEVRNS